ERRRESRHPVAFGKYRGPPDGGGATAGIGYRVHSARRFDKRSARAEFLRVALIEAGDMLLGQCPARQDDVAGCLVEVPWNRLAGRQRKCLNLDGTRHGISGTEPTEVITGGGSSGERNVRKSECRPDQYGCESDDHTGSDSSFSRHASPPFDVSRREHL